MIRIPHLAAAPLGLAAAAFALAAARAQPAFSPPLEHPTPIESPARFALVPGTRADCVVWTRAETATGVEAEVGDRRLVTVDAAGPDLRVSVREKVDEPEWAVDLVARIDPAGGVTLEPGSIATGSEVAGSDPDIVAGVSSLVTEIGLHGRTLEQGEIAMTAEDLENALSLSREYRSLREGYGDGLRIEISGQYRLIGESRADGRRVYVFEVDYAARMSLSGEDAALGMRGYDAIDAETSLTAYSIYETYALDANGAIIPGSAETTETICGFAGS